LFPVVPVTASGVGWQDRRVKQTTEQSAAERWSRALEGWAIPPEILAAAPESPWGFPPALFQQASHEHAPRNTPSRRRALEALPAGGSVLDVGVGGGGASLPLVPRAGVVVGVDEGREMLNSFAGAAERAGVEHDEIHGSWPEVAFRAPRADVVVCHHVFYNVSNLPPFVDALTQHARHRVVVELTERHPLVGLNDLWRHFHGTPRPEGPTAEDAHAVLEESGLAVQVERFSRPRGRRHLERRDLVAFVRRRLCLTADRDPEIDELLGDREFISSDDVVTLWWEAQENAPKRPPR
jgi:SAM-dependent methyltransferase